MYPVETLNYWLALGTVALQVLTLAFLALFFLRKKFPDLEGIATFLEKRGLWMAFIIALFSAAMTLYYSDVLGFIPCGLCWLQRVPLYSLIIIVALALWKRDHPGVADNTIILSTFGLIIALYQHYLQMGGTSVLPCPASGAGDCAQRIIFEFGYITLPLMAASLFALLIVLMLLVRKK